MRLYIASYILIHYDTILYHLLFIFIRYYIVYLFLLYVIWPLFNLSLKVSYWNKFKREICRQATWHFPQFTLDAITGQVYCILARRDERELGEFCSWPFGIELLRGKRNGMGKCAEGGGGGWYRGKSRAPSKVFGLRITRRADPRKKGNVGYPAEL